jgi:hypothetical protein
MKAEHFANPVTFEGRRNIAQTLPSRGSFGASEENVCVQPGCAWDTMAGLK